MAHLVSHSRLRMAVIMFSTSRWWFFKRVWLTLADGVTNKNNRG